MMRQRYRLASPDESTSRQSIPAGQIEPFAVQSNSHALARQSAGVLAPAGTWQSVSTAQSGAQ